MILHCLSTKHQQQATNNATGKTSHKQF